jgi:serine/threonine-protein kinase
LQTAIALKPDQAAAHYELGNVLLALGRLEAAAAAFRQAITREPEFAEAHCNLSIVLRHQGEFTQALAASRRGHELGSRRRGWPYPSAEWVRECQRLCDLDSRLPAVLRGEAQPADAAEWREYARLCYAKKVYAAAARLWAGALAADPKPGRYDVACAAALAGCGRGADTGELDDGQRACWRKQAVEWLRAELAIQRELLQGGKSGERAPALQRLRHWRNDPDLAGLRDPAALSKLPAGEQQVCKGFWAEVVALVNTTDPAK